ncbi:unnamed protein product [Allacma fusca]|uniref:F-box domain-containing protein n=1 Tax=Allacma fusca TaxID=39272 RepID=A0A8J2K6G0_9HEXA|nr:unnamed protein product [Allacma fusca]
MSSKGKKVTSETPDADFGSAVVSAPTPTKHFPCSKGFEGKLYGGQPQHNKTSTAGHSDMLETEATSKFQSILTGSAVHPLYNHVILQSVFELLQVEDLKSCRQICKLWDDLATPPMLSKGVVSINAEDTENLDDLKVWMNSTPWESGFFRETKIKLFTNFVCDKITHNSYPNLHEILGPHTKLFSVSHWWNDSRDLHLEDYEHLLLHQCPNLEELSLPSTKNFKIAKDFLQCAVAKNNTIFLKLKVLTVTGETKPSPKFWRIINISPELRTLKIYCELNQEYWNPFPYRKVWDERMCNIKSIDVRSFGNESITDDSSDYFMTRKWTLENITCEMYIVADTILRVCYDNIADTLQSLKITFFNKHYDDWSVDKVHEGFLSPRLTKFKHWSLGLDDHCSGPVYCRNLLTAISLPNLVSFKMIPYEEECNDHWPNELELHTPTVEVVSQVLTKWTQLERLKMTLRDDFGVCWTSVLTGVQTLVMDSDNEENNYCIQSERAGLSNLKKLTSVEIVLTSKASNIETADTDTKCYLNDNLIYSGLVQLPTIQNIFVKGHVFSPTAVDALRNAVLTFCHIAISN